MRHVAVGVVAVGVIAVGVIAVIAVGVIAVREADRVPQSVGEEEAGPCGADLHVVYACVVYMHMYSACICGADLSRAARRPQR